MINYSILEAEYNYPTKIMVTGLIIDYHTVTFLDEEHFRKSLRSRNSKSDIDFSISELIVDRPFEVTFARLTKHEEVDGTNIAVNFDVIVSARLLRSKDDPDYVGESGELNITKLLTSEVDGIRGKNVYNNVIIYDALNDKELEVTLLGETVVDFLEYTGVLDDIKSNVSDKNLNVLKYIKSADTKDILAEQVSRFLYLDGKSTLFNTNNLLFRTTYIEAISNNTISKAKTEEEKYFLQTNLILQAIESGRASDFTGLNNLVINRLKEAKCIYTKSISNLFEIDVEAKDYLQEALELLESTYSFTLSQIFKQQERENKLVAINIGTAKQLDIRLLSLAIILHAAYLENMIEKRKIEYNHDTNYLGYETNNLLRTLQYELTGK